MVTLIHGCGFEEGGGSDGPFGSGAHEYHDEGSADGLTWDGTVKHNGRYALKISVTGSGRSGQVHKEITSTQRVISSIYFRYESVDGSAMQLMLCDDTNAGIRLSSAGVVSASAGSTYTTGPTVAADTWHLLEWYYNGTANPRVMKWRVNSVAQTDVSYAAAALAETSVTIRAGSTTGTSTVWFDDWAMSATNADYPLGPVAVEAMIPTGDGTHVSQSKFKDESGVVSTGSTTYTKVVPKNSADYWYQSSVDASAYLEWTLPDTTRANPIFGAYVSYAIRKSTAVGSDNASIILRANSNNGTVYAGSFGYGGGVFMFATTAFLTAPGGTAWTASIVNGATLRYGFATDVLPKPQIECLVLEVVFDDDPPETDPGGGGPDPEPEPEPVGESGIWVAWDGDIEAGWVEETTRVISMRWSRGASFDHVSAAGPGNATVVVQNSDGRFNPDNASGALYGLLVPSRPIWGGADRTTGALDVDTAVRGFFGGYVTEIVPTPVPGANPTAELICEDALGAYRRATATVTPVRDISRGDFRQAVLSSIGEAVGRRDLEDELDTMPFASVDARDALNVLEDLNRANSSRHFISPADAKESWYDYTLVNRLHKLIDAEDESWNADDVTELSGYRVTNDNIDNLQRAQVSPIDFSSLNEIVWTATPLPIVVTVGEPIVLWPEFADYVFDAEVITNSTGGTLATTLTNFGTSAKLELTASGSNVTITTLNVTGSSLRRGDLQTVRSEDLTSQASYGIRAGGDVSTDFIGQPGAAKAVTDYLVWKFAEPLKRPTVTRAGKDVATISSLMDRDLFDVVTLTVDRLNMVARRFEIIGLTGSLTTKHANVPHYSISYELQETPNQEPLDYWIWDISSWNTDIWAPF